jgi:D-glycero-D-manno-heptose 1,7-bisphosphate phosphatase
MRAGVFIERDGILNFVQTERNQPLVPLGLDDLRVNMDAVAPLRQLKDAGFMLIATTNQPALSRGLLPRRELDRMHTVLRQTFRLDDILICPHDQSDMCPCRKPKPGLLTEAAFKWHLDLDRSYVISDKWQDAEAAWAVGTTSLLLQSPWVGKGHRDFILPNLELIAKKILQLHHGTRALVA